MKVYAVTANGDVVKVFLHKSKANKLRYRMWQKEDGQGARTFAVKTFHSGYDTQ